jgi:hypothetical protein
MVRASVSKTLGVSKPLMSSVPQFPVPGGRIFLQILRDKSGSFLEFDPIASQAQEVLISKIKADASLKSRVRLAITEMSGTVGTSGYQTLNDVEAPEIPAGGFSPFGQLVMTAMSVDQRETIQPDELMVHVAMGDWQSFDDLEVPLAQYRTHQEKFGTGVHVFLINIGDYVNKPIANTVSTRYQPFDSSDQAYEEIFNLIFKMLKSVATDRRVLRPGASIDVIAKTQG